MVLTVTCGDQVGVLHTVSSALTSAQLSIAAATVVTNRQVTCPCLCSVSQTKLRVGWGEMQVTKSQRRRSREVTCCSLRLLEPLVERRTVRTQLIRGVLVWCVVAMACFFGKGDVMMATDKFKLLSTETQQPLPENQHRFLQNLLVGALQTSLFDGSVKRSHTGRCALRCVLHPRPMQMGA